MKKKQEHGHRGTTPQGLVEITPFVPKTFVAMPKFDEEPANSSSSDDGEREGGFTFLLVFFPETTVSLGHRCVVH